MMYNEYKLATYQPALQSSRADGAVPINYETEQSGEYRIQNSAAAGYLIYIGVNAMPDFTQPAASFSASLPITIAWPLPGSGIQSLYIVPRYRDSYGCISQNSHPWIIKIDPSGKLLGPLPTPESVYAAPKSNGNIMVTGQYPTQDLEDDPADKVRIWVSTGTIDITATHTYQDNRTGSPWAIAYGSYAPGTYNVAVAYYRTLDGAMSTPVYTTVTFPEIPGISAIFTENITP